ncbi:MAG: type II toxin-antitoxin system PemK/MazF family toxin [Nitrospirae bacterium]|jgi:mRNA interferase MazF|nr:type II toxin-antitoxin system PemK/MazF family toxin [Nitrospirota bacterium]MBI3377580.1 type II toxin-antitoxin system PemK/MazF family toxin [Nitrospirota bacterium]
MNYKWRIFSADLNPVTGSEQRGKRPVLVISDEDFNIVMPVVTVLPLTSLKEGRKIYPNEVLLKKGTAGLPHDSVVLAHQIRTISKQRLKDTIGLIADYSICENINEALKVHLNL